MTLKVAANDRDNELPLFKRVAQLILDVRGCRCCDDRKYAVGAIDRVLDRDGARGRCKAIIRHEHLYAVRRRKGLQPPCQCRLGGVEAVAQVYAECHRVYILAGYQDSTGDAKGWTRGEFINSRGNRCLVQPRDSASASEFLHLAFNTLHVV